MDQFDLKILTALQAEGRLTNQELAEVVNLSASQCSRRRIALEKAGVITGYQAQISRSETGNEIIAFVSVRMELRMADLDAQFSELVRNSPAILEAHLLTGDVDYLLKIAVRNPADLHRLINETLLTHGAVRQVISSIALDTVKEGAPLPVY